MKEFRIFGPPGTGKTTRLATRDIPRAVDRFGPEKVMITSFTRAAAKEIATKRAIDTNLPIEVPESNVGTLHSICYHALNQPKIMEVNFIKEWNAEHTQLAITGQKNAFSSMDDAADDICVSTEYGDEHLSRMNIYRNKMLHESMWPSKIRAFKRKWDKFKKKVDALDFTDLIEKAVEDMPYAPGSPEVLFVDEAQDFTKLQLKLARNWAMEMQWIVLVGDDDQTIYHFTGADPFAFLLPPVPDKMKTVLNQSYRVPVAVMQRANDLIKRIENREPKHYNPRKNKDGRFVYGEVNDKDFTYKVPDDIIPEAADYAKEGQSVMILASCSYMLEAVKTQLKRSGIPFSNEYRRTRGDWNPLASRTNAVSAKDLLLNFLATGKDANYWNVPQFISWAKFIKTSENGLIRGKGKKAIKTLAQAVKDNETGLHTVRNVLDHIIQPSVLDRALARDTDWFFDNLVKSKKPTVEYPLHVLKKFGQDGLEKEPKITIGTIHSVKGAEADVVYLFPDISWNAQREYETQLGKDAIHRVFYVGITRAKEILNIGQPAIAGRFKQVKSFVEF